MLIEDLRTFVEVADAGGINSAARRLGIGKSVVSRRLARLEEDLNVQLLSRTARGALLTEAGILFRDRAASVCAVIDTAREEMSPEGELRGLLRIAAPATFGSYFSRTLAELARRHPLLNVHARFNDRYVDLVAEGFDCGIRVGWLPDSNLVARRIGSMPVHVYASPSYIAAHGAPETPNDLLKHSAILPGANTLTFSDGTQTFTVSPQGRYKADYAPALADAAAAGIGITVLAEIIAQPYVERGALTRLMPRYSLPPVGIYVVRPPSQHDARKVRVLIDLMVEMHSSPSDVDSFPKKRTKGKSRKSLPRGRTR